MSSYSVISGLYAKLKTATLPTGVFDEFAPEGQTGPYVVIGLVSEMPGRLLPDTEREGAVQVHIWSNSRGKLETLEVFDEIDHLLCNKTSPFLHQSFEVSVDQESGWVHGVAIYRYHFERND